jgi:hypothetical protein
MDVRFLNAKVLYMSAMVEMTLEITFKNWEHYFVTVCWKQTAVMGIR